MAYTFRHGDSPLEGYTIQRAVGRGGFGEVYYALSDSGREVALKYLRDNPMIEHRGVQNCMNLKSPYLVSIFDMRKNAAGEWFVIMEYVAGPSLRDLLVAEPQGLGPQKAAFFTREIAKGLAYLHDRGIVHRDLKPGNIFYDEGYVKIGDYGLSKSMAASQHSLNTVSVGTVHYMAPEVGSGQYHRGIDIYALGIILYEMLVGRVPFEGSSMAEVLIKHLQQQPEMAGLPAAFAPVVRKALEKDPQERYQNVNEMIEDLLEVEEVRNSVAGFNPVSLSVAVRRAADIADSPVPSPNPPPVAGWRPPITPQPVDMDVRELPPKMARRAAATHKKVDRQMERLAGRHGRPAGVPVRGPFRGPARQPQTRQGPRGLGEAIQRLLLATALAIGLGLGAGLLACGGDPYPPIMLGAVLLVLGVSGGVALGGRGMSYLGGQSHPGWVERMCLTVGVALCSLPALGCLLDCSTRSERVFAGCAALLVSAGLVKWRCRVESGASGKMSVGSAIWAGALAFFITMIFVEGPDHVFRGRHSLTLLNAGVLAASSLVVQALAWLFPLQDWLNGRRITPAYAGEDAPPRQWPPAAPDAPTMTSPGLESPPPIPRAEPPAALPVADPAPGQFVLVEDRSPQGWPARWAITRALGAIFGFSLLILLVALFFGVRQVVYHHAQAEDATERTIAEREWSFDESGNALLVTTYRREGSEHRSTRPGTPTWVLPAGVATLGLAVCALRKMSRYRRGGFYRDTLRPLLMVAVLTVASAVAMGIPVGQGSRSVVRGNYVVAAGAVTIFLVLLFRRGRRIHPAMQQPGNDSEAQP